MPSCTYTVYQTVKLIATYLQNLYKARLNLNSIFLTPDINIITHITQTATRKKLSIGRRDTRLTFHYHTPQRLNGPEIAHFACLNRFKPVYTASKQNELSLTIVSTRAAHYAACELSAD